MFKKVIQSIAIASVLLASAPVIAKSDKSIAYKVHKQVNSNIKYTNDIDENGKFYDSWDIPTTKGDCEDFALLKRKLLIERGFAPEDLSIVVFQRQFDTNIKNKKVIFMHAVLHIKSLDVILDIDPIQSKTFSAYGKGQKIMKYDRWAKRNSATFYCEVQNLELGSNLTLQQRCFG